MATVLSEPTGVAAEEMVHVSIPILKWEEDGDGDLIIKGIATDGTVDSDEQIVDPVWSAKALDAWISSGGNVRQSHDPHRPIGKGLRVDVDKDGTGKHWVTSVVVDPLAQKLIKKGVLTAYSVGISRPVIKHDPSGRARGGIIAGGEFAEISVVDRPSNKSSYLELAKSAADGTCEFTGKMVGTEGLQRMLDEPAEKSAATSDISSWNADEALFSFSPKDMADLVKNKIIRQHYQELAADAAEKRDFDRGVGGGVDRDKLPEGSFAGPHRSFPIVNQSDVSDAMHLAGHADNPDAVRANIRRIAHEKGLEAPEDGDGKKEDIPDVVKDPATMMPQSVGTSGDGASASPGKKLNSQSLDADGDMDGDGDATGGIPKADMPRKPKKAGGKKGKNLPPWLNKPSGDDSAEKCHTDPKTASGAEEPADMQPAPVGELMESPAPSHMKAQAVSLRYKTIGIDSDMGALHDFTCPAYSPETVASYHPLADFSTLINENVWQRKALAAATGRDMEAAMEAQKAWQAAAILKTADMGELNAYRLEMHKAFRDANPGPTSFPSPGTVCAQQFHRPVITDGRSQNGPGYGSPNSSSSVATSAPNAHSFSRPPLGSAQQSPSPSFMKAGFPYPEQQGVPTHLSYPEIEKDKARRALSMMHDHLAHQFPSVCPIIDQDAYAGEQNPTTSLPQITGLGKAVEPETQEEVLSDVYKFIRKLEKKVRAGEITEEEARERLSKRTAEKYARNLVKDVQKGMTSIDEVRKALGIEVPAPAIATIVPVDSEDGQPVTKGMTPGVLKTMMSEILQPFQQQITTQNEQLAAQAQQIAEYQQRFENQQETIDVYGKRFEALANTADPTTNAFTGYALRKAAGPAAIAKQAEVSEQVNGMMMRQLERTWRTSENPAEREAAYSALNKMKNPFE